MGRIGLRSSTGRTDLTRGSVFLSTYKFIHPVTALPRCHLSNSFFLSHTVNLLGNLPLPCLDVLLMPKVQQGSIEYMGVNMDAVNMLLDFMEKRLDRVRRAFCYYSITTIISEKTRNLNETVVLKCARII